MDQNRAHGQVEPSKDLNEQIIRQTIEYCWEKAKVDVIIHHLKPAIDEDRQAFAGAAHPEALVLPKLFARFVGEVAANLKEAGLLTATQADVDRYFEEAILERLPDLSPPA